MFEVRDQSGHEPGADARVALSRGILLMSTPDSGSRESKDWMGRTARIVEHFSVCLRPGIQIQRLNKQFVQGSGVKPKFAGTFRQREDGICRYKFAVGRGQRHCRRDPV